MTATMRAELRKLASVPSTYVTLVLIVLVSSGLGLADASAARHGWATMSPEERAAFDPVGTTLGGFDLGSLGFGVFGVLAVCGEYATGLIDLTLTAVPRRGRVFAAKACCVIGLASAVAACFVIVTFLLGQRVLAGAHADVAITSPGVARTLAGAVLYLVTVAVLGLGLGALVRHTAAALGLFFTATYLAYGAARTLEGWTTLPSRLVLANVADALGQVHPPESPRTPSLGLAAASLLGYVAISLLGGCWRFCRDPS